ncbi:MAG: cupin domain-containing protein [Actinomycetota bacterium]
MAHLLKSGELPRLHSTRDTRDRVDLVTSDIFPTTDLKADRITYHPGDTSAAHSHPDCKHFFFILEGEGILHVDTEELKLGGGDVVMLEENEVHRFENRSDANFVFIELWVPAPPTPTVWVSDDQCTWAPNT